MNTGDKLSDARRHEMHAAALGRAAVLAVVKASARCNLARLATPADWLAWLDEQFEFEMALAREYER